MTSCNQTVAPQESLTCSLLPWNYLKCPDSQYPVFFSLPYKLNTNLHCPACEAKSILSILLPNGIKKAF